ncbi:MAG: hypothetical protein HY315_07485 [Acidobacteria bacterium]|nr:hypothetical protein [Acidobacteriota bacterium]
MRRTIILLISASVLASALAKKFWEDKPYTEWSQEQARSILSGSPWVTEAILSGGLAPTADASGTGGPAPGIEGQPGASPGAANSTGVSEFPAGSSAGSVIGETQRPHRRYYVRLQSAAPVRMALARLAILRGRVTAEQSRHFVEAGPNDGLIVVAVESPEGQDRAELERLTTEPLKAATYLLLKKSKEKIYLERYLTPAEAEGNDALFLFPRVREGKPLVSAAEEEIRFMSKLSPKTELTARFALKNMGFKGKAEF